MAVNAIYQHHERSTLALTVADLQSRETGIDGATGYFVGYSATLAAAFYIPSATAQLTATSVLTINASGRLASIANFTHNGTTFAVGSSFSVTQANGNTSVGGTLGVTGLVTGSAAFLSSGGTPRYRWDETDATTDTRLFDIGQGGGSMFWRTRTDADGAGINVLEMARSGVNVSSILLRPIADGGDAAVGVENQAANAAADLSERVLLNFRFGTVTAGQMIWSKIEDFTSAANRTAKYELMVRKDGSDLVWYSVDAGSGIVTYGNASATSHAFTGPASFSSTLAVTGATTLSSTLGVTGAATLSSTLVATGLITATAGVRIGSGNTISTFTSDTFTVTLTGVSGTVTGTAYYSVIGDTSLGAIVALYIPALSGTSNTTALGISGIPAALRPSAFSPPITVQNVKDSGNDYIGRITINSDGTATFAWAQVTPPNGVPDYTFDFNSVFTSSGTKGFDAIMITYLVAAFT